MAPDISMARGFRGSLQQDDQALPAKSDRLPMAVETRTRNKYPCPDSIRHEQPGRLEKRKQIQFTLNGPVAGVDKSRWTRKLKATETTDRWPFTPSGFDGIE